MQLSSGEKKKKEDTYSPPEKVETLRPSSQGTLYQVQDT